MSFYASYPVAGGNQIVEYANFAAFPVTAPAGSFALDLSTGILYEFYMGSWVAIAGPGEVLSIGTYDLQPGVANGLQIVADQLYAQSATASVPGMVSIGNQTFAGIKNFNSNIFAANLSGTNSGDVTLGTANGLSLSGQILSLSLSSASTTGALSNTDWNTFNNKQSTLTLGNLTDVGTDGITITNGTGVVIGTGTSISQHVADTTHNGYLSSTDWNTFNGKGTGSVTSISVASANGLAGTSSGGATPSLTLSTTITGVLKGNATAISAATVGTDYSAGTAALTTGILKSTTTTGALTIAVAGDFPTLNQNTTGTAANITASSNITLTTLTALSLPATQLSGTLQAAQEPAHTGDVTNTAGSLALSLVATSNTTLISLANLATVGTIGTGVWNGTTIATAHGGTGQTSLNSTVYTTLYETISTTLGDITYGGASGAPTRLAGQTTSTINFLAQTGTGSVSAAPAWTAFTAPTVQTFTSSGGGTYTTPTSPRKPLYLKVTITGGGGGGGANGTGSSSGGNGGATTFSAHLGATISSAGGGIGGANANQVAGGTVTFTGGTGVSGIASLGGGYSGPGIGGPSTISGSGGAGGVSFWGGGGGGGFTAGSNAQTFGAGGGGAGAGTTVSSIAGGAAGATSIFFIANPAASYDYSIGIGGSAGSMGTGGTGNGGLGIAGVVIVEEFYQ